MSTVQLTPTQHSHVVLLDGEVRIVDFGETDPYVHRVLSESADPEEATHTILRVGAQAILIAGADLDAQVVERRFEGLARDFDSSLGTAVSRIGQVSSELLDGENGALLQRVRAELKTSFFGLIGEASARPGCIPSLS